MSSVIREGQDLILLAPITPSVRYFRATGLNYVSDKTEAGR
ncbi:MAG TPA: hypothetical protein VF510_24245 [Ktedonobacterales bacterium]